MAIVIVFLSCHSTKIIVNFYEALQVADIEIAGIRQYEYFIQTFRIDGQIREAVRAPGVDHALGEGEPLAPHHQLCHQHYYLLL